MTRIETLPQDDYKDELEDMVELPHPLDPLSVQEIQIARRVILSARHPHQLLIRNIYLEEPAKKLLLPFLDAENEGATEEELNNLRPPRLARCIYDVVRLGPEKEFIFHDTVVDLGRLQEIEKNIITGHHAPLSV